MLARGCADVGASSFWAVFGPTFHPIRRRDFGEISARFGLGADLWNGWRGIAPGLWQPCMTSERVSKLSIPRPSISPI